MRSKAQPSTINSNVSIIISGRNSEKYIDECIQSALQQTVPCEIIYSDDSSIDTTLSLAQNYNILITSTCVHEGVVAARNRGYAMSTGDYVCFVDADDILPSTYIADHLASMTPNTPFVYGNVQTFGLTSHKSDLIPYSLWDKWGYNAVNSSSLYARWAFEAAGKWQDGPSMWDYDLALRASRFGEPRTSNATLLYRRHSDTWSHNAQEYTNDAYAVNVRRKNICLCVATILSGRVSHIFPQWLDKLALSVRQLKHSPPLLIIAIDPDSDFTPTQTQLSHYTSTFSTIRVEKLPFSRDKTIKYHDSVSTFLSKSLDYIRNVAKKSSDVLFIVEDDIIVPLYTYTDLYNTITQTAAPVVSGIYKSRHNPTHYVGGYISNELKALTGNIEQAEVTGCGCMMTWLDRPCIPKVWPSHIADVAAHDWAYCKQVVGKVLIDTNIVCEHIIE